jgi:BlaI family transcriptional regulator, penicillinase repressor
MDGQRELSRREREIMNIVFAREKATAAEVWKGLSDRPSRTAVRTMLRILEDKGRLTHEKRGREHLYRATAPRKRAGQTALRGVLRTFFDGSLEEAVAAHLADARSRPSVEELQRLARLIEKARENGEDK